MKIDFNRKMTKSLMAEFANYMIDLSNQIGFKISSRGWCYIMEGKRIINKNQFDKIEKWINTARKRGFLPIDFVAEDSSRMFHGVEEMNVRSYDAHIKRWIEAMYDIPFYYDPNWWEGEEYYIQMIVEKVDLITLSQPVLEQYHIPIANAKGWSSMLQRATYAKRFLKAEEKGMKCVLLYFGDHDPDGLRIADNIRGNLIDLRDVMWSNGEAGYDPSNLKIDRIGLTYDFIKKNKLTWIDNLITGSGKDLASRSHRNYNLPYLQNYLKTIGIRKCEANACVTIPKKVRKFIDKKIQKYLGADAIERFKAKKEKAEQEIDDLMEEKGLKDIIQDAIDIFEE